MRGWIGFAVLWWAFACVAIAKPQPEESLHEQAVRESLEPIHPGEPGRTPFWNKNAKQFMWAPTLEFTSAPASGSYLLTALSEDGSEHTNMLQKSWASLAPIWEELPEGPTTVTLETLDEGASRVAIVGRRYFHRAAVFNGPYGSPVLPYAESARVALDGIIHEKYIQSWRKTGKPDPDYGLNRYLSKVIGSFITAGTMYASQEPRPKDADDALQIARAVADYMIEHSLPAGSPLEHCPPTYHGAKPTERENDNYSMMISPAEAGQAFLNLYDATSTTKYLDAARNCAMAYKSTQLTSGTWWLKIDNVTGKPLAPIELEPTIVILFLDRLSMQYKVHQFDDVLKRAVDYTMQNPARTFNWQAQFDDAKLRGAYENLGKHEACEFAIYLFQHAQRDSEKLKLAEDLIHFAEDQFVTWENPPKLNTRNAGLRPDNWILPCSLEQYAMFEPISGSSAFMIMAYLHAYQATGKQLYLAKAQSLGNGLTKAQQMHKGRYPTRMIPKDQAYWVNSSVNCVRAMRMLAEYPLISAK